MPKPNLIPMGLVAASVVVMAGALAWGMRGAPSEVGVGRLSGAGAGVAAGAGEASPQDLALPGGQASPQGDALAGAGGVEAPPGAAQAPGRQATALALRPESTWEEVQGALAAAHMVTLAPPRQSSEGWLAYAESWEHRANPQACLLRFRKVGPALRLAGLEPNPGSIAIRQALGTDPTDWSLEVERLAKRYAGHGAVRLEPAGPGGVALLGERHRLNLRDAQGNPTAQGQLMEIGGPAWAVPLLGHLSEGRRVEAAYLSAKAERLALIEAFPHSGLGRLLRLERAPGQQAFHFLPELPPHP